MRGWKVWMQGLAVLALLNPGYAQVPASKMRQSLGKLEGQLNILAWPGYIERGQSDPNYDWVTPFEKATGCKVNVKVFASSDEAVALMNQGGYDLVTASGDATLRLIYGNKVQPVNYKLVPSTAKLDKRLRNGPWYVVNGVPYGGALPVGTQRAGLQHKGLPHAPPPAGRWCLRKPCFPMASPIKDGSRLTMAPSMWRTLPCTS